VLSDHERRVLDELERTLAADPDGQCTVAGLRGVAAERQDTAAERQDTAAGGRDTAAGGRDTAAEGRDAGRPQPPVPAPRRWDRHRPAGRAVVAAGWLALLLLVTGATEAAFAVVLAAGLAWSLWRFWPELRDDGAPAARPATAGGKQAGAVARRAGAAWLSRYLKRISEVE
jgi:hypothetical protein